MEEFLKNLDPEVLLTLLGALGVVLTAVFTWVARTVTKRVARLLDIRLDQSVWTRVDWVAQQAALATQQAFKSRLMPEQHPQDRAAEKMAHAKKVARDLLPEDLQAKVSDKQLEQVIESHVATLPPAGSGRTPSMRPTSLLPPPLP